MKMKSIRLDFPAESANGLSDNAIKGFMQDAFIAGATARVSRAKQEAYKALARATADANIDEYDDHREKNGGRPACGPVFYIP